MKRKEIILSIILAILMLILIIASLPSKNTKPLPNDNKENTNNEFNFPTKGNEYVIETKSDTKIRIINEYTTEYFTTEKTLLIMFGSWCAHCKDELKDVEQIVNFYKNNEDINVILIAHEFDYTISDLIKLVEQDFNFGTTPVFVDLKRIIRGTLDPEASTVPISYVVDKDGNVLKTHSSAINLDIAKDMLK